MPIDNKRFGICTPLANDKACFCANDDRPRGEQWAFAGANKGNFKQVTTVRYEYVGSNGGDWTRPKEIRNGWFTKYYPMGLACLIPMIVAVVWYVITALQTSMSRNSKDESVQMPSTSTTSPSRAATTAMSLLLPEKTPEPTPAPTLAPTAQNCTNCSDDVNDWMIENALIWSSTGQPVCSDMNAWVRQNRCNQARRWAEDNICQRSCFEVGKGYPGDECCTSASSEPAKLDKEDDLGTKSQGLIDDGSQFLDLTNQSTPSLFCMFHTVMEGPELELAKFLLSKNLSIFACEEYAVFSQLPVLLGLMPHSIDSFLETIPTFSDPLLQKGNTSLTASWLNTETFMHVWQAVKKDGRYKNHDWTVKVDPDAVFFPDRLRAYLRRYDSNKASYVYNLNCWVSIQFIGPLEIMSSLAVDAYLVGSEECKYDLQWKSWGEDLYMQRCLDFLRVDHEGKDNIISDCSTTKPGAWPDPCACVTCADQTKVALHPFKAPDEYMKCIAQATVR